MTTTRVARRSAAPPAVPHALKWHGRLLAGTIFSVVYGVSSSLRLTVANEPRSSGVCLDEPVIFATWHNRLAVALPVYQRVVQRNSPERKVAALVSASKDGALLARILEHFRVQPARGSSSRRGSRAMLELIAWSGRGYDLAITPDGPRGPLYRVQEGVVALAQLTGRPIIPAIFNLPAKVRLNSWDKFQIPIPFSRCEAVFGAPVRIAREISDEEREAARLDLQRRMLELTRD